MDSYLIDYLKSGNAWVLVGSGPSVAMGYPSWQKLARTAIQTVKSEVPGAGVGALEAAYQRSDFPYVFEEAKTLIGGPRLIQALREVLQPIHSADIYKLITRWPVPVYLTTNYDDEILNHLVELGEAYLPYSNSEDHLAHLVPGLSGAIFKLHGDLRSETGLMLTTKQYREVTSSDKWQYWRTKMTSVFQMNRIVVIGYSLTDKNIQHVLVAAKRGAGVHQPICWIARRFNSGCSRVSSKVSHPSSVVRQSRRRA